MSGSTETCVMCQLEDENMNHFKNCMSYGKVPFEMNWTEIFECNHDDQNIIAV